MRIIQKMGDIREEVAGSGWIRIKLKGRIRIRIKVKERIRIHINVMRISNTAKIYKKIRADTCDNGVNLLDELLLLLVLEVYVPLGQPRLPRPETRDRFSSQKAKKKYWYCGEHFPLVESSNVDVPNSY